MSDPARDDSGRWLPGTPSPNPGGRPRNPWRVMLERIAGELDARTGEPAVEAILRSLSDSARDGDTSAASILLDRLIPKAKESDEGGPGEFTELFRTWPDWLQSAAIHLHQHRRDPLGSMPRPLREALGAAFRAIEDERDPGWAFMTGLDRELNEATRRRIHHAVFDDIDLSRLDPAELDRRIGRLDPADLETLNRIITQLRTARIDERIEAFMNAEGPNPLHDED